MKIAYLMHYMKNNFEEITENTVGTGTSYGEEPNSNVSNDFYTPTQSKDNSSRTVLY